MAAACAVDAQLAAARRGTGPGRKLSGAGRPVTFARRAAFTGTSAGDPRFAYPGARRDVLAIRGGAAKHAESGDGPARPTACTACRGSPPARTTARRDRPYRRASACAGGEVILREGRLGRELFIILDGTVVVTRAGRVVNEWGPGDYFGEFAAIEAAPRSATVTATSDLDVLIVGPREFDAMMEIPGFRNALLPA